MIAIKLRNFKIAEARILYGKSVAELAELHNLSTTSIRNILKAQLTKIAETDYAFARRLSELEQSTRTSEDAAQRMAKACDTLAIEADFLRNRISILTKENNNLTMEIKAVRKSALGIASELKSLQTSKETPATMKYSQEYTQVKENMARFRTSPLLKDWK